jgi:hypothetical protein
MKPVVRLATESIYNWDLQASNWDLQATKPICRTKNSKQMQSAAAAASNWVGVAEKEKSSNQSVIGGCGK